VVVAGVHIRRARAVDIVKVLENAGRAVEMIIAKAQASSRASGRSVGVKASRSRPRRSHSS